MGKVMFAGPKMTEISRGLRRMQTPAEKELWERLRDRQLGGYKIRRQQPMMTYVMDFYCREKRLGIEIDGSVHRLEEKRIYDAKRQRDLEENGVTIIRFTNTEVAADIESVLRKILITLHHL